MPFSVGHGYDDIIDVSRVNDMRLTVNSSPGSCLCLYSEPSFVLLLTVNPMTSLSSLEAKATALRAKMHSFAQEIDRNLEMARKPSTRRQRKSHFPASIWDSSETYLEDGRHDIRDLARSP